MVTYDNSKRATNLRKHGIDLANCEKVTNVKRKSTSATPFSDEQMAAALTAAPDIPVEDADNPSTEPADWDDAIVSHSLPELRKTLAQRRGRGSQKKSLKVSTTIRFDADVLAALRATGKGWQTRVNDTMREWVDAHGLTGKTDR